MAGDSVIQAIQAALDQNPGDPNLRRHLAELLVSAGRGAEALTHAQHLLAVRPDDHALLQLAAQAATLAGNDALAASYTRMAEALGGISLKDFMTSDPPPTKEPEPIEEEPLRMRHGGSEAPLPDFDTDVPDVRLSDVAGLVDVKQRLELSFLGPMRNEEMRKMYKKSLKGGLLLYGPPGCGKTFLAKAIAGELMARFISISITDVIDMYIGQSEKNLHELFELARRIQPCVIFMDELDALGRKRSLMRESAGASTINQLLQEMDGMDSNNEGVFVLAATNHPWDVDAALRRPGRFDRTILVLPPDDPARRKIIADQMEGRPVARIDLNDLVKRTSDFSGADLVHLVDTAAEYAMSDAIKTGRNRPVEMADFDKALREIRPSIRTWLETARNFAIYANEGGAYDDLAAYLRQKKMI